MLNNIVIKALNKEHGKEIVKYFERKGFNTKDYTGEVSASSCGSTCYYYGVIKGEFSNYSFKEVNRAGADIFELPSEYPKSMWVRNTNLSKWEKRVVIAHKCNKYIAWGITELLEEAETCVSTYTWNYAKDLYPEEIQEFTFKDISEGKATGIPPHLIRIKE